MTARVRRLSGGQRQAVALARAVAFGSKLVILDEPTAALGVQETERVEQLILGLKERGTTILIVSHNVEQVLRLSDNVVVMRGGRTVARRRTADTNGQELVALVTGAIQDPIAATHDAPTGTPLPEALAFTIRRGIDLLGVDRGPILLCGGGTRDPFLRQLITDVVSRPMRHVHLRSASAVGAAVLAARGIGHQITVPATITDLTPADSPALDTAYERWLEAIRQA